MKNEEHFHL